LCQVMGASVYDDRRFVHGEIASLQLVENARTHLLGFSKEMPWADKLDLFQAHYLATKGRHVFQGMGALWTLVRELPEPEPLVCDECGSRLHLVADRDTPTLKDNLLSDSGCGRAPPGWDRPSGRWHRD
jgi:hypothetical protein